MHQKNLLTKKAYTEIPLSPEERYQASKAVGGSLFSALQLVREQEARKNLELKRMQDMDSNVLRIPIPEHMMPAKRASHEKATYSVIENPDGSLEHKKRVHENPKKDQPMGKRLGLLGGAAVSAATGGAALPAMATGLTLGAMADAPRGYAGMKYKKTIEHLDGTKEHLFEEEKGKGVGAHLKRNAGKYLGLAGGMMAGKHLPGSTAATKTLLPLAGLVLGKGIDRNFKEHAVDSLNEDPEVQQKMLFDADFRKKLNDKKGSDILGEAINQVSNHPIRMLVGGQEGFRDAKKNFYLQQKAQIAQELMKAQRDYIDTLSRIKTGSDTSTPCVDAFCNGICYAAMFDKTAAHPEDVDISDGSVARLMDDTAKLVASPLKPAATLGASSLLGTSAGAAYLTYLLKKKMREEPDKYMDENLPTRVELQPYR